MKSGIFLSPIHNKKQIWGRSHLSNSMFPHSDANVLHMLRLCLYTKYSMKDGTTTPVMGLIQSSQLLEHRALLTLCNCPPPWKLCQSPTDWHIPDVKAMAQHLVQVFLNQWKEREAQKLYSTVRSAEILERPFLHGPSAGVRSALCYCHSLFSGVWQVFEAFGELA